jgi:AcrR family transcriptional regulator
MNDLAERLLRAAAAPPAETDPTTEASADAALRQFELFGVSRSTMDDIARRAKVARVTLYRRFPGKDALIDAVMQRELHRFLADLDTAIAPFDDVDDRLVAGFIFVLDAIRGHRLLQRILESEPETLLPHLTTQGAPFLGVAREYLAARLRADLADDRTPEDLSAVADVVVRLILSYLLTPPTLVDLDDPDQARAFAMRYLRPVLVGAGTDN